MWSVAGFLEKAIIMDLKLGYIFKYKLKICIQLIIIFMMLLCRKLLMRWTVLMSDLMIFFPTVLYFVTVYYSGKPDGEKSNKAWHAVLILLNPCLILIDHGHFQVYREMQDQCCYLPHS